VNGFIGTAPPTSIVHSFRNAGISINRLPNRIILAKTTPETVRLFKAGDLIERYDRLAADARRTDEAEHRPEDLVESLDLEGYAWNCAAHLPGEYITPTDFEISHR
jgi:hypothetical protein